MSTTLKEAIARHKNSLSSLGMNPNAIEMIISHILADIKGEKGDIGPVGPMGLRGPKGEIGETSKIPGPKGERGADGKDGRDGETVDEENLITKIILRLKLPENGKDGTDAKVDEEALRKIVKEEIEERVGKQKIGVGDVVGLGKTIESLRVARNLGGHGGTTQKITATGIGNMKYNLSKTINPAEIAVFVGGARLFEENGDFSYPAGGHISQITLAAQFDMQVQSGTTLNVRGK